MKIIYLPHRCPDKGLKITGVNRTCLSIDERSLEITLSVPLIDLIIRYNVEGEATPNPYRIRPLLGVKMPVNSSYSPVIQIHNPHPTTIQV